MDEPATDRRRHGMSPDPDDADHDDADHDGPIVVDAIGKACPLPVIDLAAAVEAHTVGTVFRLLADDEAARVDVPVWCRLQRQRLDDVRDVDDHVVFTVTKVRPASGPRRPTASQARP